MTLTTVNSPLVSGAQPIGGNMAPAVKPEVKLKKVKVVRAFYWRGEAVTPGAIFEGPALFCDEMVSARKAEHLPGAAEPAAKPSHQQQADLERGGPETRGAGPGGAPPAKSQEKAKDK